MPRSKLPRRFPWFVAAPGAFVCALVCASFAAPPLGQFPAPTQLAQRSPGTPIQWTFTDDFSGYPPGPCLSDLAAFGPWTVGYGGFGCVQIEDPQHWLHEAPLASTQPGETHASLVVGPYVAAPFTFRSRAATIAQLRQNSPPNPWEVAWIVWDYADDAHFYYFALKTNGWELGKRDPAYPGGQRFLATGASPSVVLGAWATIVVRQSGATLAVDIDPGFGAQNVVVFTDLETPYGSGRIGFYNEDAHVHFDDVRVTRP